MPAGFQVLDQYGNVRVDGTRRIARFLGAVYAYAGVAGAVVNDGLLTGTPFPDAAMAGDSSATWFGDQLYPPAISFSGNVMSWSAPGADHLILMWVY